MGKLDGLDSINNLSERQGMTPEERLQQLQKDLFHINRLVFPVYSEDLYTSYNQYVLAELITPLRNYTQFESFHHECDLVTIGWLVIAFEIGSLEAEGLGKTAAINDLYHKTRIDDGHDVSKTLRLFHMALELGTRMINGEGEGSAVSFEPAQFDTPTYLTKLASFYQMRTQNEDCPSNLELIKEAYTGVQSIIQKLGRLVKHPEYRHRLQGLFTPLYKTSSILEKIAPHGYSATTAIFNQAINAVDPIYQLAELAAVNTSHRTRICDFKNALYELKYEVLDACRKQTCDDKSAKRIATNVFILAEKIHDKTLTQDDINAFNKATQQYRMTPEMHAKLDRLIYATVALLAVIAAVASVMTGAGIIGATFSAAAGVGVGLGAARYTIWNQRKVSFDKFDALEKAAEHCIVTP